MQQLILKTNLSKSKRDALIQFLKSWDIDAEFKTNTEVHEKAQTEFSLATGLWKDFPIDGDDLRKKAWAINQ